MLNWGCRWLQAWNCLCRYCALFFFAPTESHLFSGSLPPTHTTQSSTCLSSEAKPIPKPAPMVFQSKSRILWYMLYFIPKRHVKLALVHVYCQSSVFSFVSWLPLLKILKIKFKNQFQEISLSRDLRLLTKPIYVHTHKTVNNMTKIYLKNKSVRI